MPDVFDCPFCGRHYEGDDAVALRAEQQKTGYCCEYCKDDNKPEDHKALRIKQLIEQMKTSAAELWQLTGPTKQEIHFIHEQLADCDQGELIDMLITENSDEWFQALSTSLDVLDYRVAIGEEQDNG